jgi:hypothetical protein
MQRKTQQDKSNSQFHEDMLYKQVHRTANTALDSVNDKEQDSRADANDLHRNQ